MSKTYLQFTEMFSNLSPYELNHMCEVMLCKIEETACAQNYRKKREALNERDLQFALINAMRDIAQLLREREAKEQRTHMFTTEKIAA